MVVDVDYRVARARCHVCIHPARSVAQADVYELEWDGRRALLKDFTRRPWLVRMVFSRRIAAREARMLQRLEGLRGTPQLLATAGPEAFIMEYLPGDRIPRRLHGAPPEIFWKNARALIEALHSRGIAHGDLRRKNILVGSHGEAYLIDFATAVRRSSTASGRGSLFGDFLFERCRKVDRNNFARIMAQYRGDKLDATEQAWLADLPFYLRAGRFLKKRVYRLRKPRFWRRLLTRKDK